ncbi:MAG: TetR/AcrR family transcriptional regulator [Bacillota bacterium]|nr:TetR/AcrR family transcriptional regulator [Bacillota bacterium]MDW7683688.1 TetR/AcrR family transcriptional regulator [Bacillota bacterium]
MDKRVIQRQRTQRYMIDAVKEIIAREGADGITVRRVADIAGYSYATIYNYFTDVNELLWYVAADYLDEIIDLISRIEQKQTSGLQIIKETYKAYVFFYLQNPAVYRFLFFKELGPPPAGVEAKLSTPVIAEKQAAALLKCAEEGRIKKEEIPVIGDLLTGYVHGLLLFYFSDRKQLDREGLLHKLELTIDYFLGNSQV